MYHCNNCWGLPKNACPSAVCRAVLFPYVSKLHYTLTSLMSKSKLLVNMQPERWRGQSKVYLVDHVFPYFFGLIHAFPKRCVWPLKVKSQIMLLPTCKDCWIDHENMECISSRDQARHSCLSKGMRMEIRAFDNDITLRCTRRLYLIAFAVPQTPI